MKKISEKKLEKLYNNHVNGIKMGPNARQLKLARNTVKKYLREHGLLGFPCQVQNIYLTSTCRKDQRAFVGQLSRSNQSYSTSASYDASVIDPPELQFMREENKRLEKIRDDRTILSTDTMKKCYNLLEENSEKNKKLEQSEQNNTELISINQKLIKMLTKYEQLIETNKCQHQSELDEQKNKHDQEIDTLKQKYQDELNNQKNTFTRIQREDETNQQKLKDDLTKTQKQLDRVNEMYKEITEERDQLKDEKQRLEEKQGDKWIELGVAAFCGVCGGLLLHPKTLEWIKNFLAPRLAKYGLNMNDLASLFKNAMNSYKPTPTTHERTYNPVREGAVPTKPVGSSSPGFHTEVNMATYTSDTQPSGVFFSNNIQSIPIQEGYPFHESFPFPIININYFPFTLQTLHNDVSDVYLMKLLKKTTGEQFEKYLGRFFNHQRYQVFLTKRSHDKGADLIIKMGWEKTVIQAKQQKDHIREDAIQEVCTAQKAYHATRSIVITPSQFTKPALELAKEADVECWDGTRLLQELYNHQFFYAPEEDQNHDFPC